MLNLYTKNYKDFELLDSNYTTIKRFSGAKYADKALPGDHVSESIDGCKLIQRCQTQKIVGLIELNSKTKYGFTSRNVPIYLFIPFNEAYPPFVVGCSHKDTSVNRLALIAFDSWTETFPRGSLIRLLDIGADMEALFWTYTPLACEKFKGQLPEPANQPNNRPIISAFHIDPPDCRDVDDVLSIEIENDSIFITITISDVAETIKPDSELDLRAQRICQTFYQDGNQPKHVFPQDLSEQRLSLLPGSYKPGLSLKFSLDDPTQLTWFESMVKTSDTYTYESIYANQTICKVLEQMCTVLNEPTKDSHKWIEVAMKFYNQEVAKLLYQEKAGLLRVHHEPDIVKLDHLTKINPDLKFLAYESAVYISAQTENPYHYGLQTALYTHATSPIRRYADLINQRVIKAILNKTPIPNTPNPYHLNYVAKQAKKHDRDLIFITALKNQTINQVKGQIVQIQIQENLTKISIYVYDWQLIIKVKYPTGSEPNTILSKNNQESYTITEGQIVDLNYYFDMTARSWKKRLIIRLSTEL